MIPDLNNLIKALECEEWRSEVCKTCRYGYQYLDDHGDNSIWICNESKLLDDALFYLKLYQYLIKEQKNGK